MPDAVIGTEFDGSPLPHDLTALKNRMPVSQCDQAFDILVDHQNGLPAAAQRV